MSAGTVLAIAIPLLVVLAALTFAVTMRRGGRAVAALSRDTRAADPSVAHPARPIDVEAEARARYTRTRTAVLEAPPAPPQAVPRDPEEIGMTRRRLFNRGILAAAAVGSSGLGAAVLAFLWPGGAGGFGARINAGRKQQVLEFIAQEKVPFYVPQARGYLTPYPRGSLDGGKNVYDSRLHPGMEQGLVALFQKCPHLGCRVPWCATSQWFECPCHGSKYNRVGEKRGGPAPRGMDRFPIEFDGENVVIDTGQIVTGPAIGTNTTGQEPEGPHCV